LIGLVEVKSEEHDDEEDFAFQGEPIENSLWIT